MKKSKKLLIIAVVILTIISAILGWLLYSDRPFETISANEIGEINLLSEKINNYTK